MQNVNVLWHKWIGNGVDGDVIANSREERAEETWRNEKHNGGDEEDVKASKCCRAVDQ